jgi:hypothetical protein
MNKPIRNDGSITFYQLQTPSKEDALFWVERAKELIKEGWNVEFSYASGSLRFNGRNNRDEYQANNMGYEQTR